MTAQKQEQKGESGAPLRDSSCGAALFSPRLSHPYEAREGRGGEEGVMNGKKTADSSSIHSQTWARIRCLMKPNDVINIPNTDP